MAADLVGAISSTLIDLYAQNDYDVYEDDDGIRRVHHECDEECREIIAEQNRLIKLRDRLQKGRRKFNECRNNERCS
jgi:hypothetical protein